jgi:hypothetical protein
MFKGNTWKTLKHYLKTSKSYGRSIAKLYFSNHIEETNGLLPKKIYRNKKIENSNNNKGNEQIKNKKATTNNKTMQTQQHGK